MSTTLIILALGIGTIIATYAASKEDQAQKDRIENLSKDVKALSITNNQLISKVDLIVQENKGLTEKNIELSQQIQKIGELANTLIDKVDKRTDILSQENALTGKLDIAFDKPLLDNSLLTMRFGTMTSMNPVKWFKSENPPIFISIGDKELVPFRLVDNKLKVNLIVYDLNGNWVAEITNNFWRRNPNNTGKFNYDKTGFEIVDNRGFVVVSVDLISNTEIKVQGYLINRDNGIIFIGGESGYLHRPLPIPIGEIVKCFETVKVSQLFKYTGDHWIGERIKK